MKIAHFILGAIVALFVTIAGIWIYDTYKSKQIEKESAHVALLTESKNKTRALQIEQLNYGFLASASIKTLIQEILASNGNIPESNTAAGLREPSGFRDEIISSLKIGKSGTITLTFLKFPEFTDAWIKFIPKPSPDFGIINWRCQSNVDVIKSVAPTCQLTLMKNIQVIDGAANSVYDIFSATDEEFALIFPEGQDIAFIDEVNDRGNSDALDEAFKNIWRRRIPKRDANGIHGILFYGLEEKKQYYPTRKDEEAINPNGSQLRQPLGMQVRSR